MSFADVDDAAFALEALGFDPDDLLAFLDLYDDIDDALADLWDILYGD